MKGPPTYSTAFSPATARPLNEPASVLLRANAHHPDSTLTEGERGLIATYVSAQNDCYFCQPIHGAVASQHPGDTDGSLIDSVKCNFQQAAISAKLKASPAIADSVQQGGKYVVTEQIESARAEGATNQCA